MSDPVEVVGQKVHPPQGTFPSYSASRIALYGIPLAHVNAIVGGSNDNIDMQTYPLPAPNTTLQRPYIVALIYGYAYQGHCYSLPEPVALVVPHTNETEGPAVGCGYDSGGNFNYSMWMIDKLEKTVQIQMTNDTFEELLLRRNVAGARPPLSYRSTMQLAHRGGRLVE